QVRDVDAASPSRDQDSLDLGPHLLQEAPVLTEGQVPVVFLSHVVWGRSDHKVHTVVRQFIHRLAGFAEDSVQKSVSNLVLPISTPPLLGKALVEPTIIERAGIMTGPSRRTEPAGLRPASFS